MAGFLARGDSFGPVAGEGTRGTGAAQASPKNGFTLIELSIVLVVIGLIVGGVLVGQGLIKAVTLRSVLKQQEQFRTAAATFRDKYGCVPGDCTNASSFGFTSGSSVPINGDGNGIIGNTTGYLFSCCGAGPNNEMETFWLHLSQSKLISSYSANWSGGGGYISGP